MAHIHNTKDAETHFIINATTREISNAGELPALAKGDHNSEVFTFVANRFVDGHDLTTCNIVKVHYLNIESETRKTYADIYKVEDMHIDETDSTKVVFTWLISKYATQYAGLLNFAIHFNCETDGVIDYSWKTAAFTGITVKNSIDSTEQIMTEYTDILEKWKAEIETSVTHKHDNKNTLDAFSCEMLDNPKTDGDFNFGVNTEDWNRLKFQGTTLLYNSDGAVVSKGEEVEIDGQKYFRLYFNQPGLVTAASVPSFVDIPVNAVEDKFDIGSNGVGLVLPTGGEGGLTPEQAAQLHSHDNKDLLDTIGLDDNGRILINGDGLLTESDITEKVVSREQFDDLCNSIDEGFAGVDQQINGLGETINSLAEELSARIDGIEGGINEIEAMIDEIETLIDESGVLDNES